MYSWEHGWEWSVDDNAWLWPWKRYPGLFLHQRDCKCAMCINVRRCETFDEAQDDTARIPDYLKGTKIPLRYIVVEGVGAGGNMRPVRAVVNERTREGPHRAW